MHDFKISFVVPCFNVREYIEECLLPLSKLAGSYDVEVVAIDDGSTDSTAVELDRWKERFPEHRFVVLKQKNKGLSAARNSGIKKARGEYIFLLDSDDYINYGLFSAFVDELEISDADAIFFNHYTLAGPDRYWESGQLTMPSKKKLYDRGVVKKSLYRDRQFYAWSKVFRKSLYDDVEFPVGRNFEDISTIPKLVDKAESFYYIPMPLVFYRQREGSIVKQKTKKNVLDLASALSSQKIAVEKDESVALEQIELSVYLVVWSLIDLAQSGISSCEARLVVKEIRSNQAELVGDSFPWFLRECRKAKKWKLWLKSYISHRYPGIYYKFCVIKYRK